MDASDPMAPSPSSDVMIDICGLCTRYGNKVVHDDLNLKIHRGEILVLMGGSGSGKSTLLRSLIGLESPAAGRCLFQGQDIFAMDEEALRHVRRHIAYAFQDGALFDSLTVEENLSFPLLEHPDKSEDAVKEAIRTMLAKVHLPGVEQQLPAALSGGMQKRVGLARALMCEPAVILYDEPTAGLDPANTRAIADIMLSLRDEGKTGVLVTHDVACGLRVADRMAFIRDGKIAALQSKQEFAADPHPLLNAYINGEEMP